MKEKSTLKDVANNYLTHPLKNKGITLITLVITIIIIIILATITLNLAVGDGGLIKQAETTKNLTESTTNKVSGLMSNLTAYLEEEFKEPEPPPEPEGLPKVEEVKGGEAFTTKTTVEDAEGNEIVVPAGFKIASDSGNTVQQGIVIEDVSASTDTTVRGSQFVWIPVGVFIKDDGTPSNEIILGRYTFATTSPGTPTLQQAAYTSSNPENYKNSKVIELYFNEYSGTHRDGVASIGSDALNASAYDLKAWIDSVKNNGGYYIGRYEASFASGTSMDNYKAATKVSNGNSSQMEYIQGRLWHTITQIDASRVAINTYKNSSSVKSDLMNSYAWDTAIVFIQEAGHTNYANQYGNSISHNLTDTGTEQDEACNINDMGSNLSEWTTEYSSLENSGMWYPATNRGGFSSGRYTASRENGENTIWGYFYVRFPLNTLYDIKIENEKT